MDATANDLLKALRVDDHVAELLVTPKPLSESQRNQLRPAVSEELVDSLITLQPRSADHAELWFRMGARLALVKPNLMTAEKIRDKVMVLAVEFRESPGAVHWFSVMVNNVTAAAPPGSARGPGDTPNIRALYCTTETRAVFSTLARSLTHSGAADKIKEEIRNPIEADKAVKAFNERLSLSITWLGRAIASTTHVDPESGETVYNHESIRDALLSLMRHPAALNADSVFWLCASLSNVTRINDPTKETCFGTEEVRDALIHAQKFATTAEATQTWCGAIANITTCNDADARKRFATDAMRLALVDAANYATTSTSITLWCSALNNLTLNNAELKKKWATLNVREALCLLALNCSSPDAVRWWCWALFSLIVIAPANPAVRSLWSESPVRDALCCVTVYAKEDDVAANVWLDCVEKLTCPTGVPDEASASQLKAVPSGAVHGAASAHSTSGANFSGNPTQVSFEDLPDEEFCQRDIIEAMLDVLPLIHNKALPKWKRTIVRVRKVQGGPSFEERKEKREQIAKASPMLSSPPSPQTAEAKAVAAAHKEAADDLLAVEDSLFIPPPKRPNGAGAADPDLDLLGVEDSLFVPPKKNNANPLDDDDDDDLRPTAGALVSEASL